MKKALIPILSALLVASVFTGCRKNVATETTDTTAHTTQATSAPSTAEPTTRPTRPIQTTPSTQATQMPSILPETSGATDDTARGRMMPPRY